MTDVAAQTRGKGDLLREHSGGGRDPGTKFTL